MEHYRLPSLETLGLLHPHPIDFEEDRDLFTQPIRLAPLGLGPVTLVAPIPLLHPALLQPFPAFPQPFPAFPQPFPAFPQPFPAFPQHPFLPPLPPPPLHIPALPPPPPPATPTPSSPQGDRASSPPFAPQADRDHRRKGKAKARFKSEEPLPGRSSRGGSRPRKNQSQLVTSMDPQPDLGAGPSRMLRVSARDRSESSRALEGRGAEGRRADEGTSGGAVQVEGARGITLRKLCQYTFPLGPKGRPRVRERDW